MKAGRRAVTALLAVLCMLAGALSPVRAETARSIGIYLDGVKVKSDVAPFIIPKLNVTMVPLRMISEGIGAQVAWNQPARTVTITSQAAAIEMTAGRDYALVNGSRVALDASVQNRQGRIMVPLRFVGEQLGLRVEWNQSDRTIALMTVIPVPQGGGSGTGAGNGSGAGTGNGSGAGSGTGAGNGSGAGSGPGAGNGSGTGSGTGTGIGTSLRGAWVSTVFNLDWPSDKSYGNPEQQKQEFISLLDDLQGMGMNAVFVQVRPAGDAFYPSALVPWSKFLTGVQGKDPGYDPLAFMIEETHKRGMQFHAWFNPFRASAGNSTDTAALEKLHPEWIVQSGSTLYINPGIPEARQHIVDAIMEVVNRYHVDGVHLDDYFYPSSGTFDDDAAFAAYNDGAFADKADWRRDNINRFVQQLGAAIHQAKPSVRFGISPYGVWRNKSADPTGSDTQASVTAYDSMYADVRTWIREGWIDYVTPQIYWSLSFPKARYDTLVDWWVNEVKGTDVALYIGHAPYKLGTKETGWQDAHEIINQLEYNKRYPEVGGDVFFSAKDLRRNPLGIADLLRAYYGG